MRISISLSFLFLPLALFAQKPRLVVPIGHTEMVNAVAYAPAGGLVLTGSEDKSAKLWDRDGKEILTFAGHSAGVTAVSFSPNDGGKFILTGSGFRDRTIRLWNLDGQVVQTYNGHTGGITALAFSRDGARIISSSQDSTAIIWDRSSGRALHTLRGHGSEINSVAVSPDGKYVFNG